MSEEPDTAKQLNPVVMFDGKERDQGPGVKDFRPIAEYVDNHRGKGDHLGGLSTDLDGHPDAEQGEPDENPEDIAPPKVTVGTESDDKEEPDSPPVAAPEEKSTEEADGGKADKTEDDIPSPWDEPTSD